MKANAFAQPRLPHFSISILCSCLPAIILCKTVFNLLPECWAPLACCDTKISIEENPSDNDVNIGHLDTLCEHLSTKHLD